MEQNLIILSSRQCGNKHVSYNTILGLENEFNNCDPLSHIQLLSKKNYILNKILKKIHLEIPDKKVIKNINNQSKPIFYAAMNAHELELFICTLKQIHDHLIIYIFDCWEPMWNQYKELLKEINPWAVCFAYKKATEHFKPLFKNCWFIPQSMDSTFFHEYNVKKSRLFIQMGRKTDSLHKMILAYLDSNKLVDEPQNYVYEKEKGRIIFPSTEKLAKEISKSYFFVAAPQNIANNKYTGSISEVTARFYEAMACKTVIIGYKPQDSFDDLFPYDNAMIEVNESNFISKIQELLMNQEKYNKIVEQNYNYVMKNHKWENRYFELQRLISSTNKEQ